MEHPEKQKVLDLITLLSKHEMAIGNLYERFSKTKSSGILWHELAKQEFVHHQWLVALFSNSQSDNTYFNSTLFNVKAIETSLDYIGQLMKKADQITDRAALNAALDIEKGMIEHNYFDIFLPDSPKVSHILLDLKNETQQHIEMIIEEIKQFADA